CQQHGNGPQLTF
nr:immunoglobulin light chain junction region [Macaca mulatta]MPN95344.1 immunoglobulin light chain junction region [Macaca mulatta]MPN96267.1 immunoglobulin light chain junction region [Macaca mulatta]MPN97599.1 immunoglobulin light chain junction region [Macaca mulatta]